MADTHAPRILLVDDQQEIATFVTELLGIKGTYSIRVAENGLSGLRIASTWTPDLVLADINMPLMGGLEMTRRLREAEMTANTPVIIMSANQTMDDKQMGFDAGADDYITKPFVADELLMRIQAQLRRASLAGLAPPPREPSRVIGVFSPRGGAGCTGLAVNLAVGLSRMWRLHVPLIDLSLPVGSCDVMLNLKPKLNLGMLAQVEPQSIDRDWIDETLLPHDSGVYLVGGVVDAPLAELVTQEHIGRVLWYLTNLYSYVVIDMPHKFSPLTVGVLNWVDIVVMPITPDINSIKVVGLALEYLSAYGIPKDKIFLVVNWTFMENGKDAEAIASLLNHPVRAILKHDSAWVEGVNFGIPLIMSGLKTPTIERLEIMAWNLSRPADRSRTPEDPSPSWLRMADLRKRQGPRS